VAIHFAVAAAGHLYNPGRILQILIPFLKPSAAHIASVLRFLLLPLGPSRLRCLPCLLFALFVGEFFGRRFTAYAAQLYGGGVLLFAHASSITAVFVNGPNGLKVPLNKA
jgi:hypothetical protein